MRDEPSLPRVVIAGLGGDSGKTLISLGLLLRWRNQGICCVGYKKGPDFIDRAWLGWAAACIGRNLDPYLMGWEEVRRSFQEHTPPQAVSVIEGNRGLFDGMERGEQSTAELAKQLQAPVVLVLNVTKVTRTAAAFVLGCQQMDPAVSLRGVILNRVARPRHEEVIRKAIESICEVPVLGALPRLKQGLLPDRHLGLVTPEEHAALDPLQKQLEEAIEHYVESDALLALAHEAPRLAPSAPFGAEEREEGREVTPERPLLAISAPSAASSTAKGREATPERSLQAFAAPSSGSVAPLESEESERQPSWQAAPPPREREAPPPGEEASLLQVGLFHDTAFTFYYPENLESLERFGARLVPINALETTSLPPLDLLYIGGGFPETHAAALAQNEPLRLAVREAAEAGLPIYAECGGLIYLCRSLAWQGKTYPMSGVFPLDLALNKRPSGHGYCTMQVDAPNPFFPLGTSFRGHEFHYSQIVEGFEWVTTSLAVTRGQGCLQKRDGLTRYQTLATYMHVHAVGSPQWAEGLKQRARLFRQQRDKATTPETDPP